MDQMKKATKLKGQHEKTKTSLSKRNDVILCLNNMMSFHTKNKRKDIHQNNVI
jgi:hypothetical protein